jgi:hypothetical protein
MVNESIQTYFSLESNSLGEYSIPKDNTNTSLPVNMDLTYFEGRWNPTLPLTLQLSKDYLSAFEWENEKLKAALLNISSMRIVYMLNASTGANNSAGSCYSWTVVQNYNLQQRSLITISISTTNKMCSDKFDTGLITWCNVAVVVLSLISLILAFVYIYEFSKLIRKMELKYGTEKKEKMKLENLYSQMHLKNMSYQGYLMKRSHSLSDANAYSDEGEEKDINWDNVKFSEKLSLFNLWNIVTIIGNIIQIAGSVTYLFDKAENIVVTTILIGIGCLLAWINSIRYLKHIPSYFIVYKTLTQSLPTALKLLLGILPIYVGFALFGTALM